MNFSKLRHRIIFLSPTDEIINSMGETVPRYKPFKPYLPLPLQMQKNKVYLSHDSVGNAILTEQNGQPIAHKLALSEYSVAAFVPSFRMRPFFGKHQTVYRIGFLSTFYHKDSFAQCFHRYTNLRQ